MNSHKISLDYALETLPFTKPFHIAGHVFTGADVMVVSVSDGEHIGRGEASGVYFLGDGATTMSAAVASARDAVTSGISRLELREILPAGGARNAIDAALWELESHQHGQPVWQLAGLSVPKPLRTTFTISADEPDVMALDALAYSHARALKLKLTGDLHIDIARIQAVRAARPDCWMSVDANQAFEIGQLDKLTPALVAADVKLLEQPVARGREADLEKLDCPIPIAADESVLTLADIETLVGRYHVVNIKLDKCGGLTEALLMAKRARECGLGVMVGNMAGSSLAIAPAFLLGQLCDVVDLDGPIFLAGDRTPSVEYKDGDIWCADRVWGFG